MTQGRRAAALSAAFVAALAFAGSALATPKLIVGGLTDPGTSQTTIQFTEDKSDAAPARIAIYAPAGYSGTVTAAAGTQVGSVHADLQALAISPDAVISADGQVLAADPSKYTSNACNPGTHTAVWLLHVTVSGQTIDVPVFIDAPTPATDPLAGSSPFKLTMCFSSPYISTANGGAPFGVKIVNARLTLNQGTFRIPVARGTYVWRAVVTPYAVGGALPNAAGTVEARAIVKSRPAVSISIKVTNKKKRIVTVTGTATAGGDALAGVPILLVRGGKPKGKPAYLLGVRTSKPSSATGSVRFQVRFKRKGIVAFQLIARSPARDLTSSACTPATAPTLPCVSATMSGFDVGSRIVTVRL